MGIRLLKIAVIYFLIGVIIGLVMGFTEKFGYASTHAHINLLGWVSLALAGIIYILFPQIADNKLAKAHFWLHNIGLPIMVVGLFLVTYMQKGLPGGPIIGVGGILVVIAVICLAVNVLGLKQKA